MNIAKYIKQIRGNIGLTQEKFAALVGVKRSTITNYEIGKIKPSADVLLKIQSLDKDLNSSCQT